MHEPLRTDQSNHPCAGISPRLNAWGPTGRSNDTPAKAVIEAIFRGYDSMELENQRFTGCPRAVENTSAQRFILLKRHCWSKTSVYLWKGGTQVPTV